MSLQNKIDFAVVLRVDHANPNGDPLNGNRPRTDYNGYETGFVSNCLRDGHLKWIKRRPRSANGSRHMLSWHPEATLVH